MANTLYEYYQAQGQPLPSLQARQPIASQAGISNYTGSAEQNTSLLGFLQGNPNNSGTHVITGDNLKPDNPIVIPNPKIDTSPIDINSKVGALQKTLNSQITTDQATLDTKTNDLYSLIVGNQGATNEKILKENNVDTLKKGVDSLSSQIEAEQKSAMDKETAIMNNGGLTKEQAQPQIEQIQRESAIKIANLGIGLSALNRNYETASAIATRAITANSDKIKSEIEARKFILDQLGTKVATARSNAFTLQLKAIEKEDKMLQDAIKTATDGMGNGSIDPNIGTKALQDLVAGKSSLSDFYGKIGATSNNVGSNINGYDITSYATDPTHEQKVLSYYNTIGDTTSEKAIGDRIKELSPNSPITGMMVMSSANKFNVDPKLMLAIMQQDSSMGTAGLAVKTKNAGNVGNNDSGATQTFKDWGAGVDAVAQWLSTHKASPTTGTDYNQIGKLSSTDYNPKLQKDKDAKFYLDQYLKTGRQPSYRDIFGYRKDGSISDAQRRADDLYYQATGASLPDANILSTNKKLIADNNKVLNKNEILTDTIVKNFDLAIKGEITNDVNKNATIVNRLLNPFYLALGNPAVNQAMVSNGTISQEFANLISIRNANGTTVSDKDVASELIKFGTSVKAQKAIVERLKAEALNIHDALSNQNAKLYEVIDPLETNPDNPNRKVIPTTESQGLQVLTKYKTAHPDKIAEINQRISESEKVLGRALTALEFLQAYPDYAQ